MKRGDVEVLEPNRCIPMCVVVLTRSRVDKFLVCLGDFLPPGWSIRIVWKVLRTVLECEPLARSSGGQHAAEFKWELYNLLVEHGLDVSVQCLWIDVHNLIQKRPVALVDLRLLGILRACPGGRS